MLKYYLVENVLTDQPEDYRAMTQSSDTYDKNKFIKRLLGKGTLVTETDAVAVLNAIESTVADILDEGSTINMPLFNTSFSVSGVFEGPLDSFDANRHKLNVNITKGTLFKSLEKSIVFEKTHAVAKAPQVLELKDVFSNKLNEELTPGGVVELKGYNLKIAGDHSDCGLWFVSESGTSIKSDIIIQNKPSVVIAMIPTVPSGNYRVKLVTQYASGHNLITPKVFISSQSYAVS